MKIYFASDVHLGAAMIKNPRLHEKLFVQWLDDIKADADKLFLLGDVFDYWYEYRAVAPRGFVRFLGKLCELTDSGIEVHLFTGNHDVWVFDYLPSECGVILHREPMRFSACGKTFYVGHGDEVGRYDRRYMLLKGFFKNPIAQFFYSLLHPDFANWIARTWSRLSRRQHERKASHQKFKTFMGEEREYQIRMARDLLAASDEHIDYFVFGHRHIVRDHQLSPASRLLMIGDWLWNFSYAVCSDGLMEIKTYAPAVKQKDQFV